MKFFKFVFALLIANWALGGFAQAQNAQPYLFDDQSFWAAFPANNGAEQAWNNGVKWPLKKDASNFGTVFAYHGNRLFGFTERKLPAESDPNVNRQLIKSYIERTEARSIHNTGVFAFNNFDCAAKSNYDSIKPDIDVCSKINLIDKISSDWGNTAFSIIQLSTDEICSCKKLLNTTDNIDNYNIFFAPIARYEVYELYKNNKIPELLDFFLNHYKKNIFDQNQFIIITEILIKEDKYKDAAILLDAITTKFKKTLNSTDWETCGNFYFDIGDKDKAEAAYNNAIKLL
ncbi:MAG: hypothetical protein LBJ61_03185 [Deltaproteobacteria bacterium]|jgi:hypothetical protein|nr:hypothetical protein [Deltaproteobacteria bacterium]